MCCSAVRPRRSQPAAAASWPRHAKIAFIGSHGIRKTSALLAFAAEVQRAGLSVELGREVVRDNPLGINEGATGEAQLWVLVSQIRQELELARKADVLATDRGVMDNFAYYLRACGGVDTFSAEPLVRSWSLTYDLVVRLLPDVALQADGVRSTNDAFRDEVEAIATKRVLAWQLEQAMWKQQKTKQAMARQLHTSRSQLDRLLDPRNVSVSLVTITRAARVLGKRVIIRVADAKSARRA